MFFTAGTSWVSYGQCVPILTLIACKRLNKIEPTSHTSSLRILGGVTTAIPSLSACKVYKSVLSLRQSCSCGNECVESTCLDHLLLVFDASIINLSLLFGLLYKLFVLPMCGCHVRHKIKAKMCWKVVGKKQKFQVFLLHIKCNNQVCHRFGSSYAALLS